jgi:hypothetical protein
MNNNLGKRCVFRADLIVVMIDKNNKNNNLDNKNNHHTRKLKL